MADVTYVCAFPGKYEHKPKTFISEGPPPGLAWIDRLGYLPKGTEYQACDADCPACDDYGFLWCGERGRCRFGFSPRRKAWDIEKEMKRQNRCLDCGAPRSD
jgi:hypothetical protein